ncbi:hypothetical protein [Cytobacillus oceanisediminis]|uniref:Uncharacterized protein n=1 Tax=Cytobacillus oceanisediminis TaxID=665099 RepID=A0A562J719_9BACI|nr:hypothetical protein [Cytobacillus oceanisediminis]TWH78900.1 hypothetical protein IQ19_05099 [Cytobacillus oceanisediminis]
MEIIHISKTVNPYLVKVLNQNGINISDIDFIVIARHPINHEEKQEMEDVANRLGNKENIQVHEFTYLDTDPTIEYDTFDDPLPAKHAAFVILNKNINNTEQLGIVYKPKNSTKALPIFALSENAEFLIQVKSDPSDLGKTNEILQDIAKRLMGNNRTSLSFNYCTSAENSTQYGFIIKNRIKGIDEKYFSSSIPFSIGLII